MFLAQRWKKYGRYRNRRQQLRNPQRLYCNRIERLEKDLRVSKKQPPLNTEDCIKTKYKQPQYLGLFVFKVPSEEEDLGEVIINDDCGRHVREHDHVPVPPDVHRALQ